MSNKPIRVLHVIGAMDRGGAESLLMFIFRNIDKTKFSFDFLVNEERECDYDEEILALGGMIYHIPRFNGANPGQYLHALRQFFARNHNYDVVHVHIGSTAVFVIPEAHRYNIYTIAHSHNTNSPISPSELAFRLISYPTRYLADYYLACSKQAGTDRFGKDVSNSKHFSVLYNGIDLESYKFSSAYRAQYRNELSISSKVKAVCHIGRFEDQKNHLFLIESFYHALKIDPSQELFLIGKGHLENAVRDKADSLNISNKVHLLGIRDDIPELLMAMDMFVFPSKWEGLGIAAIEAQASGLPCLLSPEIPDIAVCTPYANKLNTIALPNIWGASISSIQRRNNDDRVDGVAYVRDAGFDIRNTVKILSVLYETKPRYTGLRVG